MSVVELILSARQRNRCVLRASIIQMDDLVSKLEVKTPLSPSEQLTIQRFQQKLRVLESDFKNYSPTVIDLLEDAEELDTEQVDPR